MFLRIYKKLSLNFLTLLSFLIFVSIIPSRTNLIFKRIDLFYHFFFFFLFSLFCDKREEKIFILFVPLLIEILQSFLPYRNSSVDDVISDYLGILSGFITFKFFLKNPFERFIFLGSFFYIGKVLPKMKGTVSSFIALLFLYFIKPSNIFLSFLIIFLYLLHFILRDYLKDKDPDFFTIDEVAGILPLFYLKGNFLLCFIYFLIFRFFDITKILFVKNIEKIRNFNGVFLDDLLSGFYALILTFLINFLMKLTQFKF